MSELQAYIAPTADGTGLADYYLKSEADKVIADLDESHKKEVEQLLMEIVELKAKIAEKFKEGLVIGVDKATGSDKTVEINYKEADDGND